MSNKKLIQLNQQVVDKVTGKVGTVVGIEKPSTMWIFTIQIVRGPGRMQVVERFRHQVKAKVTV